MANMYRVGDYVYFETTAGHPYHIRRIEELNKTPSGIVEAKVMCFFRRRDLSGAVIALADKHQTAWEIEQCGEKEELSGRQRHQLKHRELFLSRQIETLPATHIRGKCSVTLLNETESLLSYLNKEDTFFYCLVYDPSQKTLLEDKGKIRVGSKYQVDSTPMLKEGEPDERKSSELETLVWTPEHNLTDCQIDQFLVISRSVGTFARALECSSSVKQPSLHMSAAAASRDITLFHAMDTLHKHNYKLADALSSLVPPTGPVLCRDEMEEWSASEADLFEEAMAKYGKEFNDLRQDFLPWKTMKNIIEYYYMWKTTDRYVQQKRVKAVEAESKLKQVYIPDYNKTNSVMNSKGMMNGNPDMLGSRPCDSCGGSISAHWYSLGSTHMPCRVCQPCWMYWKKYGGLVNPNEFSESEAEAANLARAKGITEEERALGLAGRASITGPAKDKDKAQMARLYGMHGGHGMQQARGIGPQRPLMKTQTAFYLFTTPLTRLSRSLARGLFFPKRAAKAPFRPINIQAIKQECKVRMGGKSFQELKAVCLIKKKDRGSVTRIATKLGLARNHELIVPEWLHPTDKDKIPKSERVAFPKPPKAPDGSLMYDRVPSKGDPVPGIPALKRKPYEEVNRLLEVETLGPKRIARDMMLQRAPSTMHQFNGKTRITAQRTGRKQVISWMDAPDDAYFRATDLAKKMRRSLSAKELKRIARKPWRRLSKMHEELYLTTNP